MSQHDFDIANQTAASARADINSALQALASLSSGNTAPSTTYANMLWYETDTNILKMRNEANSAWISVAYLDQGSSAFRILDDTQVMNTSGTQTGLLGDQTTATWEAGTGTTESLVSPAKIKNAIEALTIVVGVGQTWQDVSGSRSDNVSYQNTSGKPIEVALNYRNSLLLFQVSSNNSTWVTVDQMNALNAQRTGFSAIIPNGYYYRTSGATVGIRQLWVELR